MRSSQTTRQSDDLSDVVGMASIDGSYWYRYEKQSGHRVKEKTQECPWAYRQRPREMRQPAAQVVHRRYSCRGPAANRSKPRVGLVLGCSLERGAEYIGARHIPCAFWERRSGQAPREASPDHESARDSRAKTISSQGAISWPWRIKGLMNGCLFC